jgi:hypothetical protein
MHMTFFLPKGRELTVDENWHDRGRKRILYLLVVVKNGYDIFPPKGRPLKVDENWQAR